MYICFKNPLSTVCRNCNNVKMLVKKLSYLCVNVQVLLWHMHKNMQDIFIVLWAHCNGVQSASIAVDVSLCP